MNAERWVLDVPSPEGDPGRGRRLGFDVGKARIGVSSSDPDATLATPVQTVAARDQPAALLEVLALIAEYEPVELIVGIPRTLRGDWGAAAEMAVEFATSLRAHHAGLPIRLVDERLTTVVATQQLHASGKKAAHHRPIIDQVAAVGILQSWLDQRRSALATQPVEGPQQ